MWDKPLLAQTTAWKSAEDPILRSGNDCRRWFDFGAGCERWLKSKLSTDALIPSCDTPLPWPHRQFFKTRSESSTPYIYKKLQTAPTSHSRAAATHGKIRALLQNFSLGKLNFPASPVPSLAYYCVWDVAAGASTKAIYPWKITVCWICGARNTLCTHVCALAHSHFNKLRGTAYAWLVAAGKLLYALNSRQEIAPFILDLSVKSFLRSLPLSSTAGNSIHDAKSTERSVQFSRMKVILPTEKKLLLMVVKW